MISPYHKSIAGIIILACFAMLVGCSPSPEQRSIDCMRKLLKTNEKMLDQLESVRDKESADAATPKILALGRQIGKIAAEAESLKPEFKKGGSNRKTSARLEKEGKELLPKLMESQRKIISEQFRIARIPGAAELLEKLQAAMLEAKGDALAKQAPQKAKPVPSGTPGLEELDRQLAAHFEKLEAAMGKVFGSSQVPQGVAEAKASIAELNEVAKHLATHHECGTLAKDPQQAVSALARLETAGQKMQKELKRLKEIECDFLLTKELKPARDDLQKKAEKAENGFSLNGHTPSVAFQDQKIFYYVYRKSQGGGRTPATSWEDCEAKSQKAIIDEESWAGFRKCRQGDYTVRWGIKSNRKTTFGSQRLVLAYPKETPVSGGVVSTVNHHFPRMSPAGLRLMLMYTVMEEALNAAGANIDLNQASGFGGKSPSVDFNDYGSDSGMGDNFGQIGGNTSGDAFGNPSGNSGFNTGGSGFGDSNSGFDNSSGFGNHSGLNVGSPESFPTKTPTEWTTDLNSTTPEDVYRALYGLNRVDRSTVPGNLSKQIALKAKDLAFDPMQFKEIRGEAARGLVAWGGKYSAPLLVQLLDEMEPAVQSAALEGLKQLGVPDGAEAASKIFAAGGDNQAIAAEYLESVGPKAEKYVLDNVRPVNFEITQKTVRLLGKVGTSKSFKAFKLLENMPFYDLIEQDIQDAKQAIRSRKNK